MKINLDYNDMVSPEDAARIVNKLMGINIDDGKDSELEKVKHSFMDDICTHVVETITDGIDRIMQSQLLSREEKMGMTAGMMAAIIERSKNLMDNLEVVFKDISS